MSPAEAAFRTWLDGVGDSAALVAGLALVGLGTLACLFAACRGSSPR